MAAAARPRRTQAGLLAFAAGPANDNFTFAQFLPGKNDSVGGRTIAATAEPGELPHQRGRPLGAATARISPRTV